MPAATLLNADDRSRLIQRLQRVRPDAQPAWGALDAPRMLCHLADNLRVALGDVSAKPVHTFASRTLVKFLVVNTGFAPPRGKIQTAPEFRKRMLDMGIDQSEADTPEKHAAFVKSETEKWGKVIREAGVKAE